MLSSARRLHSYLVASHWTGACLSGPDVGVRLNYRYLRFVKGYLPFLPWADNYAYVQAQAYWIADNWLLADLGASDAAAEMATACADFVLSRQDEAGYWPYPNPEWKGRIATVEGDFGALALLESYRRTSREAYLAAAVKWSTFLNEKIGYEEVDGGCAVNYFASTPTGLVPNNATLTVLTLARLHEATGDAAYLSRCEGMLKWLASVQLESGELPYSVAGPGGPDRPHYLCYQYNSFEFLDLAQYHHLTGDETVKPVLRRLASYLAGGVSDQGAARYDCAHVLPEVNYYTMALGAALSEATRLGLGDHRSLADPLFARVLSNQRRDGGMSFFSRGNYGFLSDRRSYPRSLSMLLCHLLTEASANIRGSLAGD
jgi:hypothetical protein